MEVDLTWDVTINEVPMRIVQTGVVNRFKLMHNGNDPRAIWHPNTVRPFELTLTHWDTSVSIVGGEHLDTSDEEWAREQWAERFIARTLNDVFSGIRWEATNR